MGFQSKTTKNIGIVGLGLIGGSLALDLKRLGHNIYGVTHRQESLVKAQKRELAQVISTDYAILDQCSIIFLAQPLKQLLQPTTELLKAIPKESVVSDVGSVKMPVLKIWRDIHPRFIASHPMAGTHKSGVEAGQYNLFKGRPWVSTPETNTDLEALSIIQEISLSLGSKWITADPQLHDDAVALISHLPVFVSAALLKSVASQKDQKLFELAQSLASSGFEDTTRVGGGNSELGVSMARNNKENILKAISIYKKSLETLEEKITNESWGQLQTELTLTKQLREQFRKDL